MFRQWLYRCLHRRREPDPQVVKLVKEALADDAWDDHVWFGDAPELSRQIERSLCTEEVCEVIARGRALVDREMFALAADEVASHAVAHELHPYSY